MESTSLSKLQEQLRELFRAADKDLNYGIYRIMHQKNKEIDGFIDKDLPKLIKDKIQILSKTASEDIDKELEDIEKKSKSLGVDPKTIGRYNELLREKKEKVSIKDLEDQIYNHLVRFFERYYQEGDFISRFYFKDGTYLIPYDGSEVDLHWVTKDMYYVKSTDQYTKFSFSMNGHNVVFKVSMLEEEKGNQKGKASFFNLDKIEKEHKEIIVSFKKIFENEDLKELGKTKVEIQQKLNEKIADAIKKEAGHGDIIKNIEKFQKKYTEDFFIHKDLKIFLTTQAKFYINQEILDVDSVITDAGTTNNSLIVIARVFKELSNNVIEKLSLLEDLKKKVWEKKKFILQSNYVITLDKIHEYCGEEFLESILEEIVKNKEQVKEWKELFDVDIKSKKDLFLSGAQQKLGAHKKEYLKLPVDTKHFSEEFKWLLLSKIDDIDEKINGVLFHSENWQALNFIQEKYKERIQSCYIDPPFNLGENGQFLYKTDYLDSSWCSMLQDRIILGKDLIKPEGSMFVRCEYNGNMLVRMLMNNIFRKENFMNELILKNLNTQGAVMMKFNPGAESLFLFSKRFGENVFNHLYKKREKEQSWIGMHSPRQNKSENSSITINGRKFIAPKGRHWTFTQERANQLLKDGRIRIAEESTYIDVFGKKQKGIPQYLTSDVQIIDSDWTDIRGYSSTQKFSTENSEILLKRAIESTSNEEDLIIDFFLGSATTIAVAQKLNRKWVGIEIGDHFYTFYKDSGEKKTGNIGRLKKVLFYDMGGISKEEDVKENYNEKTAGGFFKYHELEQYEDALENIQFKQVQLDIFEDNDQLLKYYLEEGIDKSKSKNFLGVDTEEEFLNLKIKTLNKDGTNSLTNVDLIETFNYLMGLDVEKMEIQNHNKTKYYIITGKQNNNQTLIIWRDPNVDKEKDKEVITKFLQKKSYADIFVNSDCLIRNYKNIYDEMRKRLW